jgi:hypothetical protein
MFNLEKCRIGKFFLYLYIKGTIYNQRKMKRQVNFMKSHNVLIVKKHLTGLDGYA